MYRLLLRLYPASFRNEYGAEMQAVFARQRRDATAIGVVALWLRTLVDTVANAVAVHADILVQDLRYAARSLARTPGYAVTAFAVVSLGVGATTAAFSVADFVLLRPLPFDGADRLVKVWESRPGFPRMEMSPANYRDWKGMVTSYEAFAAYRGLSVNLVGGSQPLRMQGASVTADLLTVLSVRPLVGRTFTAADDLDGAARTVLLSYGLWQQEFGGDDAIVGKTVRLDERPHTVIGVMAPDFHFPNRSAQLWTPMRFAPVEFTDRNDNYLNAIAKLKPGVSLEAARAEMVLAADRLRQQYPGDNEHTGASVIALRDEIPSQSRTMLFALLGAAACVLAIACANLANLLLVRAIARRREMAVRIALGAGRERLLRQLLTESLLVTGCGGLFGVAVAAFTIPAMARLVPNSLPIAQIPAIDLRVLAFAAIVTLLTGIGFGIVPLLQLSRDRTSEGLREGPRSGGGQREGLRGALVVAEITASVVLLVTCGLLLRTLWQVQAIDPGFRVERALTLRTSLPMPKYEMTSTRTAFYDQVLSEVRALPGVSNAGYTSFLPLGDMRGGIFPVGIGGVVRERREGQVAFLRYATPGYFDALGIALQRGRDVADSDRADGQNVVVVSRSFAERFFPGQDAIGRRFNFAGADREIVGIVADVKIRGLTRISEPQVYAPHQQMADRAFVWYSPKDLVVRTSGDPLSLVSAVRAIVAKADATVPLSDIRTLEAVVDREMASRVAQLRVLGAFAAVALLLGAIGIHGLLAFAVSARSAEIGVRMALGAQRGDVVAMVAKRALTLTAIGIAIGAVLGFFAGRGVQALLVGISPADWLSFGVAIALAFATALVGSVRPALRAARVDPVSVMRLP
jgi:predicted permease